MGDKRQIGELSDELTITPLGAGQEVLFTQNEKRNLAVF